MKVAVCGRHLDDLEALLQDTSMQVVRRDPELVISYGGDGALLGAERDYPGVPKLPMRDRRSVPKCHLHAEQEILKLLLDKCLQRSELMKLEATTASGQALEGINDIVVNKENIASAVRFRLWLDGELHENHIVGDGLVLATPFGSTGYYRSITHSLFRVGIGLAFNNSTEPLDHLVVAQTTEIEVEILRGPALLLADNDPRRIVLQRGDRVHVRKAVRKTEVLGLDIFRCPDCYRLRQAEA